MTDAVRRHDDGGVAILTLSAPPVNTLNRGVRRALMRHLDEIDEDSAVTAVVIVGDGTFSAGADLAEFDSGDALAEPTLHLTIAGALDRLRVPSVAAITGVALGGGLELALACSARVAHPDARLGLPESTLGFMPGAGGTQRLPRLVGIEDALDLIVTGRTIDAHSSSRIGLVDVVADDVLAAAITHACELAPRADRPRARDNRVAEPLAPALVELARRNARRARAGGGILAALDALEASATAEFDAGLAIELSLFERLATTEEARAARYRFLSDRASGPVPVSAPPQRVAIIGSGTMGRGIALSFVAAGVPVTLIDVDRERIDAAIGALEVSLSSAVERGRLTAEESVRRRALVTPATGVGSVVGADLIIEAVFEDLGVKQDVFRELDAVASPDAVLASNTSSLDLDAIAGVTTRPDRVVGMHFFSPADVMRLLEVVRGAATSERTLSRALGAARVTKKFAVVAGNGPGFIGNRIFDAYLRQAHLLLSAHCSPQRIDAALETWGFAMGPFAVLDIVGNDVPALARRAHGDTDAAWATADALVERGLLGRKSGAGWYRYTGQERSANPEVEGLLPRTDDEVSDEEIVERCLDALVTETARVIADDIAENGRSVDTVMVHGYGFPASAGGPWFRAERTGWDRLVARLKRRHDSTGDPFWRPHPDLVRRAEEQE